jgi:hypothetical protein
MQPKAVVHFFRRHKKWASQNWNLLMRMSAIVLRSGISRHWNVKPQEL